ncbi:MAG: ribosomal L7Ae/L30e/S12e/Gadd45 family protein [Nanoarchaeota archaeon]
MEIYNIIEKARKSGKIKKGTNEVTKAIERQEAKLVVVAKDINPQEVVQHIPILCKEKKIPLAYVDSKEKLGRAAGVSSAASIAVIIEGDAKADVERIAKESK